jgi:hypothetical protein
MPDVLPQRYHQREWLREFGHPRPHVHAAQWTHAADKHDLDQIQELTEHGEQVGEFLMVWPTFQGTGGVVGIGNWVLRDVHGNVFVMFDAGFRARYEVCRDGCPDAAEAEHELVAGVRELGPRGTWQR